MSALRNMPDRSILDPRRSDREPERAFAMDVDLMAQDALPVSVSVEVEGADITVMVEDHDHATYEHGTILSQKDIEPNDWKRLTARAGV